MYLPYKPKRRTRAKIAREAGLEPLADLLLATRRRTRGRRRGFVDGEACRTSRPRWAGRANRGRAVAEDADLIGVLREAGGPGRLVVAKGGQGRSRRQVHGLFRLSEPEPKLPSHRMLACSAARRKGSSTWPWTRATAELAGPASPIPRPWSPTIQGRRPAAGPPTGGCPTPSEAPGGRGSASNRARRPDAPVAGAEDEAVRVFAANLRDLLLAAPAGARATMGLDPGFRTG